MSRVTRLAFLAGILWLLTAAITWFVADPGERLIGLRRPQPAPANYQLLQQQSQESAQASLEKTAIWGVQRNGQPFPPPKPAQQVEAEAKIEWRFLGSIIRKSERYILIQIEKKPPVPIKEGEQLPDGSKLIKIAPKAYSIETADGEKQTIVTNL